MFYVNFVVSSKQKSRAETKHKKKGAAGGRGDTEQLTIANHQLTKVDRIRKKKKSLKGQHWKI